MRLPEQVNQVCWLLRQPTANVVYAKSFSDESLEKKNFDDSVWLTQNFARPERVSSYAGILFW